jgi:hypothetical protein
VSAEKACMVILLIHFIEVPFGVEEGDNEDFLAASQAAHDLQKILSYRYLWGLLKIKWSVRNYGGGLALKE